VELILSRVQALEAQEWAYTLEASFIEVYNNTLRWEREWGVGVWAGAGGGGGGAPRPRRPYGRRSAPAARAQRGALCLTDEHASTVPAAPRPPARRGPNRSFPPSPPPAGTCSPTAPPAAPRPAASPTPTPSSMTPRAATRSSPARAACPCPARGTRRSSCGAPPRRARARRRP
jgi:hypothetical protein